MLYVCMCISQNSVISVNMSMLSILIITEQLNNLTVCFFLFPGFSCITLSSNCTLGSSFHPSMPLHTQIVFTVTRQCSVKAGMDYISDVCNPFKISFHFMKLILF